VCITTVTPKGSGEFREVSDFLVYIQMAWNHSVERLLAKYCDEAQTREALHRRSYYRFKKLTTCFNLPVIILSCLSGSLQFASKEYPAVDIVTVTASLSIVTAIISAVSSYLKLGEATAAHEQSANAWLLFHNELKHQLLLSRDKRQDADEFIQTCKTQYDRLFELSPICSSTMINEVKKKIKHSASGQFETPSYLNGFKATEIYVDSEDDGFVENSI
jgi:hypothetical protein